MGHTWKQEKMIKIRAQFSKSSEKFNFPYSWYDSFEKEFEK